MCNYLSYQSGCVRRGVVHTFLAVPDSIDAVMQFQPIHGGQRIARDGTMQLQCLTFVHLNFLANVFGFRW